MNLKYKATLLKDKSIENKIRESSKNKILYLIYTSTSNFKDKRNTPLNNPGINSYKDSIISVNRGDEIIYLNSIYDDMKIIYLSPEAILRLKDQKKVQNKIRTIFNLYRIDNRNDKNISTYHSYYSKYLSN